MGKGFKHITNRFFDYLGAVVVTAMLIVFIFVVNNYHYFIYATIIAGVIFMVRKTSKQGWKEKGKYFLILTGLVYVPLLLLFSVSPFLRFAEFRCTHPGWKTAEAEDLSYGSEWEPRKRRSSGYAYSDISYSYQVGTRSFTHKEHSVEKLYYPVWESDRKILELKDDLLQRTKERIRKGKFMLLYNAETPSESKFFISRQLLYPQGSELYAYIIFISIIFFSMALSAVLSMRK
jgi:energy-coupling factor transporter transmembrane protein EcfT